MRDVGTAAAIGLVTGIFGGVIGFLVARVLVEHFALVEGPPAGVLVVLLISGCTVACTFVGFILAFWRLRNASRKKH
jgi:uncharacterized BrkB/YihY/UPF0761 family membrane protein